MAQQHALDLGRLHLGRPLRVIVAPEGDGEASEVINTTPTPVLLSRVRLVEVGLADGGRAVEVTLSLGDLRAVGRGPAGTPGGAAGATLLGGDQRQIDRVRNEIGAQQKTVLLALG